MKLNTTSQYAIRILITISKNCNIRYNAKLLSHELTIPYKYLTKVMALLVKANLVESLRGRDGGYILSRKPTLITVYEILEAVKEDLEKKKCLLGIGLCTGSNTCGLHNDWQKPKSLIEKMFEKKTLDELQKEAKKL